MSTSTTRTIPTSSGDVPVTYGEYGTGRPVLVLHGGAGPTSVAAFAELLASAAGSRVIVPTHPGFGGTDRPDGFASVADLAELFAGLLDVLELEDVTVIGNSLGGWVAAELAIRGTARLARMVLVDAVGIEVAGHPVAGDLAPARLIERSWYDPSRAPSIDPDRLPPAARSVLAGNRAALELYGGTMSDPTLLSRLAVVTVPTLVVWGEADRIVDPAYGREFAAAIPGARFELLARTGHVPQVETPELLLGAIRDFVGTDAPDRG